MPVDTSALLRRIAPHPLAAIKKERPRLSSGPFGLASVVTLRALTRCARRSYWTVAVIAEAAGVAAGLVVMAMVVLPVTVRSRVPLCDGSVAESPK
jgi:hypothetical protein